MTGNVKHSLIPEQALSGVETASASGKNSVLIEKEYINSMLNDVCEEAPVVELIADIIDYSTTYKCETIECTVFDVGNINLALPTSLIRKNVSEKVDLPDHNNVLETEMLLGRIKIDEEMVDIIDLECLVMNGIESDFYSSKSKKSFLNIILLTGCSIGIAHDGDLEEKTVSHSQVCWRNKTSKRLWLAGTVSKMGFSLIDVAGILEMFSGSCIENRGSKNGK